MKYSDGHAPASNIPVRGYECKHCWEKFDAMGETFMHIKNVHGIDPFAPLTYSLGQVQGAA